MLALFRCSNALRQHLYTQMLKTLPTLFAKATQQAGDAAVQLVYSEEKKHQISSTERRTVIR